jgi:hypothetical protein
MYPRKLQVCRRRRTIGLSSTALAFAALATLIPAGQAHAAGAAYDMYDYNADGWIDASAVDWNGDGWLNRNFVDVNADGFGDIWLIDENQNRAVDQFVVDSAPQDGRSDHWFLDTNEDGAIDATYVDVDGNGTADVPAGTLAVAQPVQPYVNPALRRHPRRMSLRFGRQHGRLRRATGRREHHERTEHPGLGGEQHVRPRLTLAAPAAARAPRRPAEPALLSGCARGRR